MTQIYNGVPLHELPGEPGDTKSIRYQVHLAEIASRFHECPLYVEKVRKDNPVIDGLDIPEDKTILAYEIVDGEATFFNGAFRRDGEEIFRIVFDGTDIDIGGIFGLKGKNLVTNADNWDLNQKYLYVREE